MSTPLYRQILVAASNLHDVSVVELHERYPEGDFFAIRCHGEGLICAPPVEDTEDTTVVMTPVLTVPDVYLGLTWDEVQVLRERITLEKKISDLRYTLKGKREFHIPIQEAAVADRKKKLADSETCLLNLYKEAEETEQALHVLEMQLAKMLEDKKDDTP